MLEKNKELLELRSDHDKIPEEELLGESEEQLEWEPLTEEQSVQRKTVKNQERKINSVALLKTIPVVAILAELQERVDEGIISPLEVLPKKQVDKVVEEQVAIISRRMLDDKDMIVSYWRERAYNLARKNDQCPNCLQEYRFYWFNKELLQCGMNCFPPKNLNS